MICLDTLPYLHTRCAVYPSSLFDEHRLLRKIDKSKLIDLIAHPQINYVPDKLPENCFVVSDGEFLPPTVVWPAHVSTYIELYEEHVICQMTLWQQSGCCV